MEHCDLQKGTTVMIQALLPIKPPRATAQHKGAFVRNGRVMFFTKKEQKQIENDYISLLIPYLPPAPMDGPLWCRIWFYYPATQATAKRLVKEGKKHEPKSTRPDVDNSAKALIDSMTKVGLFNDDSQIFALDLRKYETIDKPCVVIEIRDYKESRINCQFFAHPSMVSQPNDY